MSKKNGSGVIDFREYVIGMSLISQAAVTEKTVKLAFKVRTSFLCLFGLQGCVCLVIRKTSLLLTTSV